MKAVRISAFTLVCAVLICISGCGTSGKESEAVTEAATAATDTATITTADTTADTKANDAQSKPSYDSVYMIGVDKKPEIGWEKIAYSTYFQNQYTELPDIYSFLDYGFSVSFIDNYTSSITITDNKGCYCYGDLSVGSSRSDVVSAWGNPYKETDDYLMYFIDKNGNLCGFEEKATGAMFSLKDGIVTMIVISNDFK